MASKAIGFLTFKFGADLGGFERAMKKAQKSLNKFGRNVKKTGRNLSRNLTLPLVAIGGAAAKLSMDFDSSMRKITTLVGIADKEVQSMKKSVLELAGETAQAPVDLSEGLYFLTSAGLRGANALETLEAVAKASASGLGDMESLSRTAAAAQNAYGVDTLKAADALDVFGGMVKSGMFKAEELSAVLGPQLGLAAELGVSFEQVGAFISTYTKTTGDATSATTGLGGILMSFAKITPQMEQALSETGMSVEGLRTQLSEEGLQATLIQMQEKFQAAGVDLSEFFSKSTALKGVLAVLGNQTETYVEILEDLGNAQGFVDKAFKKTAEGPGFQMKQAFNSLKVAGTELGDTLAPAIKQIASKIVELTKWFSNLSAEQKNNIVKWAGILALLGPVLYILGTIATVFGVLVGVIGFFVTAIKTATGVMSFFNIVLKANPIGIIITSIGILVTAIVYFSTSVSNVAVDVRNAFRTMVNGVIWLINKMIGAFNTVSEAVGGPTISKIKKLKKETYKAEEAVDELGETAEETAKKISKLEEVNQSVAESTAAERGEVAALAQTLKDSKSSRDDQITALKELKKISPEYFGSLKVGTSNLDDITAATHDYINALKNQARTEAVAAKTKPLYGDLLEAEMALREFKKGAIEEFGDPEGDPFAQSMIDSHTKQYLFNIGEIEKEIDGYMNLLDDLSTHKPKIKPRKGDKTDKKSPFEIDLEKLEKNHQLALNQLKQTQLIEKKSQEDFDAILESEEGNHLKNKRDLYNQYKKDVTDLDSEILDQKLENTEKMFSDAEDQFKGVIYWQKQLTNAQILLNGGVELFGDIVGSSLNSALENQENFFTVFLDNIKKTIRQLLIQLAIMTMIDVLLGGKNLSKALITGNAMKVMGLADGGIVSGPTTALIGEYPGASSNPEVVAPLDKLKSMIGGGSSNVTVTGRLVGNDIYLSNERTKFNRNRTV